MIVYLKHIICLFFILCCMTSVSCIKCWNCRSNNDPKCADPFDNSTVPITDCVQEKGLQHLPGVRPSMCRKIRQKVPICSKAWSDYTLSVFGSSCETPVPYTGLILSSTYLMYIICIATTNLKIYFGTIF